MQQTATENNILVCLKEMAKNSVSGEQLLTGIREVVRRFKIAHGRIGFVSGLITAGVINLDQKELTSSQKKKIEENMEKLAESADIARKENNFPIISSLDVFTDGLEDRLELRPEYITQMWQALLSSGCFTDIFMAEGWRNSDGALLEREAAKKAGINIHHI